MYVIVSRSSSRSGDDVSDSSLSSGDEDTTSAPSGVRPIPSAGTGDHWRRVVLMLSDRGIGLGNVSNCLVQQVVLGVGEDEVVWQDLLVRLLARRSQGMSFILNCPLSLTSPLELGLKLSFLQIHSQSNIQGFFKVVSPLFGPLLQVQLAREAFANLTTGSVKSNKFTDLTTGSGPRAGAWLRWAGCGEYQGFV